MTAIGKTQDGKSASAAAGMAGFSLLELMIVCMLVGIGALAAAQLVQQTHESQLNYRNTASISVETEGAQDVFAKLAANGFMNDFLHLPVSVACTQHGDEPCIRTSTTGTTFVNMMADPGGYFPATGWTEFYREADPVWPAMLPYAMAEDATAVVQRPTPYVPNAAAVSGATTYWVTWRLTSPASQPLVALSKPHITASEFTFDWDYGGGNAQATMTPSNAPGTHYVYFAPADNDVTYNASKNELVNWMAAGGSAGGLFLVYNQEDPSQYFVQRVNNIHWDDAKYRVGFELLPVMGGSSSFVDPGTYSFSYYPKASAMISLSTVGYPTNLIWGENFSRWTTLQGSAWATPENFYPFPSEYFSMSRINGTPNFSALGDPFANFGNGVNIQKIAYYYNNLPSEANPHNHRPNLVGVPIVATTFYLGPGVVPNGCDPTFATYAATDPHTVDLAARGCPNSSVSTNFYSLRMRSLPGNQETILINRLNMSTRNSNNDPATGFVTIARQIGTRQLKVVIK